MKRRDLYVCAKEVARQIETDSYTDWISKDYPVTYEADCMGSKVQVEIVLLEATSEHLQLTVSVYAEGLSSFFPAGIIAIIPKPRTVID